MLTAKKLRRRRIPETPSIQNGMSKKISSGGRCKKACRKLSKRKKKAQKIDPLYKQSPY